MSASMTPRERAMAALNHQEPDRVPIDLHAAAGDFITDIAYRNLLHHLGLANRPTHVFRRSTQYPEVDEDILRRFGVDFRRVDLGPPDRWADRELPNDSYEDEWHIIRRRPPGGFYYDLIPEGSPLREVDTIAGLDRHPWPDPLDPGRFRGLRERARQLREESDYAVVLSLHCDFFSTAAELRGWANFYADLAGDPTFAGALMDCCLDYYLPVARRGLEEAGEYADVVVCSRDDFGGMDRLLISPRTFDTLIKPRLRRVFDLFKQDTAAKRFLHCDGAIYPILPALIELGVEALNPIQVSAAGMGDTKKLKAEFGDRLTFWGGIDTHDVLPYGTPEDVRREVKRRIDDLGPGGGYVLCSVHSFQPDVPPQNIVAMFEAASQYGRYPLKG
ncbi:MAG: hypothetical protein M0Z94_07030 [Dehalococcoidales bacterium]|nr:hypothetical protein [Dehalococcoidales bacterium]